MIAKVQNPPSITQFPQLVSPKRFCESQTYKPVPMMRSVTLGFASAFLSLAVLALPLQMYVLILCNLSVCLIAFRRFKSFEGCRIAGSVSVNHTGSFVLRLLNSSSRSELMDALNPEKVRRPAALTSTGTTQLGQPQAPALASAGSARKFILAVAVYHSPSSKCVIPQQV